MSGVLRLVYRCLSSWVIKQAGLSRKTGQTGAVTLIQRFGSALNLNLHYHLLFLDGAYTQGDSHRLEFRRSRERPAVSEKRLSLTQNGQVRYELKTPYRNGTTHVIFDPLDFIARLVALIPKPRVNLARYHGVFARGGLPYSSFPDASPYLPPHALFEPQPRCPCFPASPDHASGCSVRQNRLERI